MRYAFVVWLSLILPGLAQAQVSTVNSAADDPELNHAKEVAVSTLPVFLAHAKADTGYSTSEYSVKVSVPVDHPDADHEVIWVSPFTLMRNGRGRGELANDPFALPGMKIGDALDFSRDQIEDWGFKGPDGHLHGNYTTRVIVPRLDDKSAAYITDLLSAEPIPQNWR